MGTPWPWVACRSCVELEPEARGVDTEDVLPSRLLPTADTLRDRPLGLLTLLRVPAPFDGVSAPVPVPAAAAAPAPAP